MAMIMWVNLCAKKWPTPSPSEHIPISPNFNSTCSARFNAYRNTLATSARNWPIGRCAPWRRGEVAAPFEAQRQALDRKEQAQLADLRHKLALRVQIKLLNVLHVIQPKLRLPVQLIPAQGSGGEIEIVFDPALQKIEAPVCPVCARPTLALALTRSSHVVCPACATQSIGQRLAKSS
jgi:hypothetical protein